MVSTGLSSGGDAKASVLQATDIVELVGQTVALKRRGKDFVGLCPFHQEKTPSFHVSPSKQFFYCYGCKKGGNAIDFVMHRDRVEFMDALRLLADVAGIELPAFSGKKNSGERQTLLEALSAACLFFEKLLSHPQHGQSARQYLAQRGLDNSSIQRFRLGVALDSWDGLLSSAAMKKFSPPDLALAGLVKPRERGEGYYDTFRNRLMFPIRDESGRVIAFGGRVMPSSQDPAKYLNSPETPVFSKSRCVFGLDLARAKIIETRTVAVVEGYTDVVMAHQFGLCNVVSVLGTAITPQHIGVLRRFADRVVLVFDADSAGDAAVNRAVELFLTQPVEIAIASLPQGLDPDEFLLKRGAEGFSRILSSAADALTYKWKQLVRQFKHGDGLTAQQQAVDQYLQTLAAARGSGPVDSLRWGAALARVSRLSDIPVEQLNRRFRIRAPRPRISQKRVPGTAGAGAGTQAGKSGEPNNNAPAAPAVGTDPDQAAGPLTARQRAEGYIIGLLLLEGERWGQAVQGIGPSDFTDLDLRKIAAQLWKRQEYGGSVVLNEFLALLDEEQLKSLAVRWADEASSMPDPQSLLAGSLRHICEERERDQERKLIAQLRRNSIESSGSPDDPSADTTALRQLQEKMSRANLKRPVPER